jgi:hypothetical protein
VYVSDEIVDEVHPPRVPALLFSLLNSVHGSQSSLAGFARCLARGCFLSHSLIEMEAQLFV